MKLYGTSRQLTDNNLASLEQAAAKTGVVTVSANTRFDADAVDGKADVTRAKNGNLHPGPPFTEFTSAFQGSNPD
ncbi:hypothetical protein HEQ60_03595 [Haematospirillum sp. H1815]|uniref:hypothetical protein n=1 Tax=Haematospirillum sp. H1815 TaxID=2723108 RepID=UPI001438F92D|nr:hypothetical protein [Haematospirillum sp. H1815]NKD76850.1 hypothetical protein [Haematospirillum sp. H1815]